MMASPWWRVNAAVLTAAQMAKVVRLIQSIALTLNKHYPARLHRLFLVETPRVVHWPVQVCCLFLTNLLMLREQPK